MKLDEKKVLNRIRTWVIKQTLDEKKHKMLTPLFWGTNTKNKQTTLAISFPSMPLFLITFRPQFCLGIVFVVDFGNECTFVVEFGEKTLFKSAKMAEANVSSQQECNFMLEVD